MLHPGDGRAVDRFVNGDMRHRDIGRGTVPVLYTGGKPHHVTGADFLNRPALFLHPAKAGGNDQRLPGGMGMPGRARARLEGDGGAGGGARGSA